jgi:RES domain-containing protein
LKRIGDEWVAAGSRPVLAVPGVITAGKWNYLFNPGHPEFERLTRSTANDFVYDDRLG